MVCFCACQTVTKRDAEHCITATYMLQVNMIKKQEQETGFVGRPKRPRALILGPTKELTEQVRCVNSVAAGVGVAGMKVDPTAKCPAQLA